MDKYLQHLSLEDESDDDDSLDSMGNLEPLDEQATQLMDLIKLLIKKRKYKNIKLLFTTAKNAATNAEMLPKMSLHLYKEVCRKHMTEDTYEDNKKLYNCAEELLKRIAKCAPPEPFLSAMMDWLDPDTPECQFASALSVLESPMSRMPDGSDRMALYLFDDILDEIALWRDVYTPMPHYLILGNSAEIEARMIADDRIQFIMKFHERVARFYLPLLQEICSHPRPETEIFRACNANKRNMLCCFLIKMLDKPLPYFDLRCGVVRGNNQCPVFYAISLTRAINKCIPDPFFLLSFVEQKVRWESRAEKEDSKAEENGCYFLTESPLQMESLTIYYYMVISERIVAQNAPKIYNPLYICEMGLYLVHYTLFDIQMPALQEKSLLLAHKLFANLGPTKIPSSYLDCFVFKVILNDLRKLALCPLTAEVLLATINVLKQIILSFDDDDKYMILKTFLDTVNHDGFCGFLINVYKGLAADALKAPSDSALSNVYTGQKLRAIFLENICKLQHGVKTDPAANHDQIDAALEVTLMFATVDTKNRTGFWNFVNEIHSQYISPLRKALQFYDARYKTELLNARQGRGISSKRGKCAGKVTPKDVFARIETLQTNLSENVKLRNLLNTVSNTLANPPTDDPNNNSKTEIVKT